jgi:hypothetical protein
MNDLPSSELVHFPEGAPVVPTPVVPLVPAEAPPHSALEAVGEAVYKVTHHGEAPHAPVEMMPVVTLPPAEETPQHGSHVAALGERAPTTAEAIAAARSAVDAASHALKVAARSAEVKGRGRGV